MYNMHYAELYAMSRCILFLLFCIVSIRAACLTISGSAVEYTCTSTETMVMYMNNNLVARAVCSVSGAELNTGTLFSNITSVQVTDRDGSAIIYNIVQDYTFTTTLVSVTQNEGKLVISYSDDAHEDNVAKIFIDGTN